MKLAEALITRAGYRQQFSELRARLHKSLLVQEGETPPESADKLMEELQHVLQQKDEIIRKINRTNVATLFQGDMTLAEAIVKRDTIIMERNLWKDAAEAAVPEFDRYSRSEIRRVSTIDVARYQKQVERLSREMRELDMQIQAMNWTVDLAA